MSNDPSDPGYKIGYRRPPLHSRFKKGQSGNKHGRPKGRPSIADLFNKAMMEKITVKNGGGRSITISKIEVALTQLANQAAKGDRHAIRLMTQIYESMRPSTEPEHVFIHGGLPDEEP